MLSPEARLRSIERKLDDLLFGRRAAADPERTGVVALGDFGKRCEELAEYCGKSTRDLAALRSEEGACAARAAEEVELAARLASLHSVHERQCDLLEEAAGAVKAALRAGCRLEEPLLPASPAALVRREIAALPPALAVDATLHDSPPLLLRPGEARRAIRRAILEHGGPLPVTADASGIRWPGGEVTGERAAPGELPRGPNEPPEVKRALDLYQASTDEALRDFLLVKAVDEALFALLAPRLRGHDMLARARALPRRPGKRGGVRAEAVTRPVDGWNVEDAARAAEKVADRRAGPEWARLPKGAYLVRLFVAEDDTLAADLLALGPALKRMERGETVEGTRDRALRSLQSLLGRLVSG